MPLRLLGTLLVAVLAISLSACGGGASSSPRTSQPSNASGVDLAMSLAPRGNGQTYAFEFTDVRAVASALGVDLTRGSPSHQDDQFGTRLNAAGGVGYSEQRSLWHIADVQWQSTAGPTSGTPVLATGLRPSFDLAAIERKFAKCGYQKRVVAGAVVYAGSQSASARCAGPFGDQAPVETQIGLMAGEHVVLLSASAAAMDAAIRKEGDLHRAPATSALLRPLAGYPAVTTVAGTSFCRDISSRFVGGSPTPSLVQQSLAANPPGAAYQGFAFGSRFANGSATASIVLGYSDAKAARADLAFREHAIRTETSAQTSQPYAKFIHLDAAKADGENVVLDVSPGTSGPLRLYGMWLRSDLAFARC
jgi:hypothetical protein